MFRKSTPKISICIPVCGTEKFLPECIESISSQDFEGIEIVVVDDGNEKDSRVKHGNDSNYKHWNDKNNKLGNNNFETVQQIVKVFKKIHKKQKISIKFIKHEKNKGLVESRRSALYEATGKYVMFVDSDDTLPENAIASLFATAEKTSADIVQGKANICWKKEGRCGDSSPLEGEVENAVRLERGEDFPPLLKNRINEMNKKANSVFIGELNDRQIFEAFLLEGRISGFLWGKLFTKELCLEAFSQIPPTYCIFGEDFLTFFFLSHFAKKYVGIENVVYNYNVNTGISSNKMINSIEEWQKVCSTASVFTILFSWIKENRDKISEEEADKVREMCIWYAKNNLAQLKKAVATELQEEAYKMLCDFWGENMIKKVDL